MKKIVLMTDVISPDITNFEQRMVNKNYLYSINVTVIINRFQSLQYRLKYRDLFHKEQMDRRLLKKDRMRIKRIK